MSEELKAFLGGSRDVGTFTQQLLSDTLKAVSASNTILAKRSQTDFYTTIQGFRHFMQREGENVVKLMDATLQHQIGKGSFNGLDTEDMFEQLIEVNDGILERVGIALDKASGLSKPEELVLAYRVTKPIHTSWNKKQSSISLSGPSNCFLIAGKNVARPQLTFKDKVNNSRNTFEPIIKYKPNSIKPLAILLETHNEEEIFSHPYEIEIDHCQPTEEQLKEATPQFPNDVNQTPLEFVKTLLQLQTLVLTLQKETEISVDLEHHSYRSFLGITCLIQISTRTSDYLIDALELRSEIHILNEVFTNPRILKVFHGANQDILWLQRDFGVYVVNLFDTGQAARVLNFPHFSLSYLMKLYCQFEPDKQIRLADWRMRPLPTEMIRYAREDTHFLLYIYERLKVELLTKSNQSGNLLMAVFQKSKEVCLLRYRKPYYSEDSFMDLYRKSKKNFKNRQLMALREIFAWRDRLARTEDESTGYILPNHMMLQIAEVLPREQQGIIACCNPIPPMVRQQLNELHAIILRARETPINKLMQEQTQLDFKRRAAAESLTVEETKNSSFISPNSLLKTSLAMEEGNALSMAVECPHDLLNQEEDEDGGAETTYPTLRDCIQRLETTDFAKNLKKSLLLESLHAFRPNYPAAIRDSVFERFQHLKLLCNTNFISPFQRFEGAILQSANLNENISSAPTLERVSAPIFNREIIASSKATSMATAQTLSFETDPKRNEEAALPDRLLDVEKISERFLDNLLKERELASVAGNSSSTVTPPDDKDEPIMSKRQRNRRNKRKRGSTIPLVKQDEEIQNQRLEEDGEEMLSKKTKSNNSSFDYSLTDKTVLQEGTGRSKRGQAGSSSSKKTSRKSHFDPHHQDKSKVGEGSFSGPRHNRRGRQAIFESSSKSKSRNWPKNK